VPVTLLALVDEVGVGVPTKTPADIVAKLKSEICVVLNDRVIGARFAELGGAAMIGSSAEYRAFLVEETDKMGKGRQDRGTCTGIIPKPSAKAISPRKQEH
jgi:hypothetical protein